VVVEGEGEEEEVVVEGEEEEVATEEEVVVEGEEPTEEEEDVYEIEINGKTYYVSNEQNSVIYAADESGDITIEAGVYKNGKPVFN
jgi:YHS domain-containing protein